MLEGYDQIRENELTGMFLVVTVKHLSKKKVKARLATLRYQAKDLEEELLEAATPTAIRRAKHCFLQVANHRFELKKAGVSGASFQGREQQADRNVVPVNELADALRTTRRKPARLRKTRHGLVIAPKNGLNPCTKTERNAFCAMQKQIRVCGNSSKKRPKVHSCICWFCFTSMISCWLDAKVKMVGKSFNEECLTTVNCQSGKKDICA